MKTVRFFTFLLFLSFCCGTLTLAAAPKTLDEINMEQQKKREEKQEIEEQKIRQKQKEEAGQSSKKDRGLNKKAETNSVFEEEIFGILPPFNPEKIESSELIQADPEIVKLFETAVKEEADKNALKNYKKIMSIWTEIKTKMEKNPFTGIAEKRLNEWSNFTNELAAYKESLNQMRTLSSSSVVSIDQKKEFIQTHFEKFGVAFGVKESLKIIKSSNNPKELLSSCIDQMKNIMQERCEQHSADDCYNLGDSADSFDSQILYFGKACDLNHKSSCDKKQQLLKKKADEEARIAREERLKQEAERYQQSIGAKVSDGDRKQEVERDKVEEKQTTGQTYHPYKAAGISLIVVGALVAGGGVAAFHIMSDKEFDKYKKMKTSSSVNAAQLEGLNYSEYINKAKGYRNKSNTYRILEITSGAVGGAVLVTGIVLAAIKKEKQEEKVSVTNISVMPSNEGFYASLGFEF